MQQGNYNFKTITSNCNFQHNTVIHLFCDFVLTGTWQIIRILFTWNGSLSAREFMCHHCH